MNRVRLGLSVVAGLLLASVPFVRYTNLGHRGAAHADHAPRHGGQVGMAGDFHIEVRRDRDTIEAFVSDAWRRPVRPREGWVVFDRNGAVIPLAWKGHRLIAPDMAAAREIQAVVVLSDGTRLSIDFDFSSSPSSPSSSSSSPFSPSSSPSPSLSLSSSPSGS
jgi:hypothetical protein